MKCYYVLNLLWKIIFSSKVPAKKSMYVEKDDQHEYAESSFCFLSSEKSCKIAENTYNKDKFYLRKECQKNDFVAILFKKPNESLHYEKDSVDLNTIEGKQNNITETVKKGIETEDNMEEILNPLERKCTLEEFSRINFLVQMNTTTISSININEVEKSTGTDLNSEGSQIDKIRIDISKPILSKNDSKLQSNCSLS